MPGIPLPPELIITRSETWFKAAIFYINNFEIVLIVIKSLKASVEKLKQLVQYNSVKCGSLAFIQLHLSELSITNLEESNSELLKL